jgi:methyl-accepting chemotaxis protein
MELSTLIESAVKNGISLVVCLVIIAIFAKILQWVFKFVDKLVTETLVNLTNAITRLNESISKVNEATTLTLSKISQEIKDGFSQMSRTAQYQREEHQKMMERMEASERRSEEVRERLLAAIDKSQCKAKD